MDFEITLKIPQLTNKIYNISFYSFCPISFHIHICSGTPEAPTVLCAGIGEGKGSCPGDSGGPVTYKAGDQHVLIGDVSFGAKYCGGEEGTGHCRTHFSSLDIIYIIQPTNLLEPTPC